MTIEQGLDFEGLLDLARAETDAKFERKFPHHLRMAFKPERNAMVVRAFLERICPIRVDEAYD